ncbi:uncharacterized protein LOC129759866 [Uranotaenia lowii]|uniref:uncharacterized protein LOC129759866 n=1 Tax=Uranotaenia lowii TaxID=190385 RepID=UPI00247A7EB9|nr:uncharacterized protein LOC129759866 [Uranotaenia lowii]
MKKQHYICNTYDSRGLEFKPEALKTLEKSLDDFFTGSNKLLFVRACGGCDISEYRIRKVLSDLKHGEQCKTVTYDGFRETQMKDGTGRNNQDTVLIVVIRNEDMKQVDSIENFKVSICWTIVVFEGNFAREIESIQDDFKFADLTEPIKERLTLGTICLQGREVLLKTFVSKKLEEEISAAAIVQLNSSEKLIVDDEGRLISSSIYIDRLITDENGKPFNFNQEITVLCGDPSVGKSVSLVKMAEDCKRAFPTDIVILRDLQTIISYFDGDVSDIEIVFKFLHIKTSEIVQRLVVLRLFEERKINLFLDGFDEISETKNHNLIKLLKWIAKKTMRVVVIATRSHRIQFIKKHLSPTICTVHPLSAEEQKKILQQHWTSSSNASVDELKFVENCNKLFQHYPSSNILEIPVQNSVIASVYEDLVSKGLSLTDVAISEIVQKLVDMKFNIYQLKYFNSANRAHEVMLKTLRWQFEIGHSEIAYGLDTSVRNGTEQLLELEQFGLLRIESHAISFVHPIYQDFFLALYIITGDVDQDTINEYLKNCIRESSGNRFNDFLNHQIFRTKDMYKNNFYQKFIRTISISSTSKKEQFCTFFENYCSEEEMITYLHRCVASGFAGLFGLCYESIPVDLSEKLEFKFYPRNHTTIDLSTVNEEMLLSMLQLLNEHPLLKKAEKILTNFELDETDFLLNAIEGDKPLVIEQLFRIANSITEEEDEDDLLQEFVSQRWRIYFRKILHNKKQIVLETIFRQLEKKYLNYVLKHFLREADVLHVLIDECSKLETAIPELIHISLQFIEKHSDKRDLQIQLGRKTKGKTCLERLANVALFENRVLFELFAKTKGVEV